MYYIVAERNSHQNVATDALLLNSTCLVMLDCRPHTPLTNFFVHINDTDKMLTDNEVERVKAARVIESSSPGASWKYRRPWTKD